MDERKKILLINKSPSLREAYKEALQGEGFEVIDFFDFGVPDSKKTLFDKCANIFSRVILKDKTYFEKKAKLSERKKYIKTANQIATKAQNKFDYALFFRADLFPKEVIEKIAALSDKMITYQYDGMEICQNLFNFEQAFDRIFVFDKFDLIKYKHKNFLPLTNCWFADKNSEQITQRFFYVGVGTAERRRKIDNFKNYLGKNSGLKVILTVPDFMEEEKNDDVILSHVGLSYKDNMSFVKSSEVLLDFKLPYHDGLSFRFFEAMNYEKKLITNNYSVQNYDFYHPSNIFICDFEDFSGLQEFLDLPYSVIPQQIVDKYGFSNWIKYVLDMGDYQKIQIA